MQQLDSLNQVAEFHRTFKHPILETPTIPSEERSRLRVALLAEELKELEVAILEKDIVEVADALCDLQYVLSGAVLEFGLGEKFRTLFDEVQRSNMSKACILGAKRQRLPWRITRPKEPNVISKKTMASIWFTALPMIRL
jgi:predicted HAD superfamily Cof-like phosphohydrolase